MPSPETPLDDARAWLGRYVLTVTDADLDLLALWAAHTHVVNEVYTTPRLLIDSPVPGSGKTTCLEHLARLCVHPVQMAAVSSPALLARLLEDGMRTLLIDEADRTLRPDADGTPDLLAMLNSGYKRGATRPVLVPERGGGWVPRELPTFSPVALAGNSPSLPEDTRSRTIRVLLLPDLQGQVEESDWELLDDYARQLGANLAEWADVHRDLIAQTRPPMPPGIIGRFREKWQPLARVAAVAGGRWPAVVDALAVQDREQVEMDKEDGMIVAKPHVLLLQHLAEVWPDTDPFATSSLLADRLVSEHPEAWGQSSTYGKDLTTQRLGRLLAAHYKVNTGRADDRNRTRGYFLTQFVPVWARMGLTPRDSGHSGQTGHSGRPAPSGVATVSRVPGVKPDHLETSPTNSSTATSAPAETRPAGPTAGLPPDAVASTGPVCPRCGGPIERDRDLLGFGCLACYRDAR